MNNLVTATASVERDTYPFHDEIRELDWYLGQLESQATNLLRILEEVENADDVSEDITHAARDAAFWVADSVETIERQLDHVRALIVATPEDSVPAPIA